MGAMGVTKGLFFPAGLSTVVKNAPVAPGNYPAVGVSCSPSHLSLYSVSTRVSVIVHEYSLSDPLST